MKKLKAALARLIYICKVFFGRNVSNIAM